MISLIVAASTNHVIGLQGELPWRLSDDLRRFKEVTIGKPIIMGRKTWDSIGRPLPGRQNIVITRQQGFTAEGCDVAGSVDEALSAAGDAAEVMVIGGSEVYALFLPAADRLYVTRVHADVEGDAYFPSISDSEWRLADEEHHDADERNEHAFSFQRFERVSNSA
ncbi:MAG: type 3 dihydrofolate reductase [Woeseiaceae bacterium]|nr:type 3 dihydrofolate reductase [Woeseiaceae bacterium]